MSALHEAWTALRHGGNLLSPTALDALPPPDAAPYGLADRLRGALVAFDPEKPKSEAMGVLLDAVLEGVTGLNVGWRKGNTLGAADAEKLLDGTILKPRRLWVGPKGETVAVFTDAVARLGVGRGRRPVARVTEFLRRRGVPLALLTNGQQWRLIWADTDATAWVEWDADRWLDADQLSDELHVLRQVLSWGALTRGDAEHSALLLAIRDTRRGQARLSKELGERVRRSVETLLKSRAPLVGPAWNEHDSADLYVAASHFVMRLVVTLFAEARELLPADNPVYHQAYGLRGLIDQLDRLTPERRRARQMAWPRLLALFKLLHEGSRHPQLAVNAYGGDLFRPGDADGDGVQRALALLEALPEPPDDDTIHRMLVLLTRTSLRVREGSGWRTVAAPVDFTELTSEYIGILYEGLLDYELHRAGEHPVVFLNLGDQPALPMDRLEEMDDKALIALVEKAKVRKQAASENEGEEASDDEDEAPEAEDEDAEEDSDDEDAPLDDDETPDDARALARARATDWARKAVVLAKLVMKPRGRLTADKHAAYDAQIDSAAAQLVADLKLPGELYLVRWGGTRKGAGTFYTRPQLTLPTVRRTLEPLIRDENGAVRAPEELLALKVCDPAMGSGSFLVAALRVLTAAVVEALHTHGRIYPQNGRTAIDCALVPEGDRRLPTEGFEERLEAVVRRAVVEHCLYGVDKDPLAVELGRVALWVETLDRDLPFTFLDHKLRCGDSLVGTWLDRFRDYPLLAFDRQSPDKKWKGVHHEADVWHEALKERRAAAIAEQVELLSGQARLGFAVTSDEELKQAVERVRRMYRELRAVPAGRPDERARIWRTRIQADAALARVRTAFDTWCSLWFWPLDKLDVLPLPRVLNAPSGAALAVVKGLRDTQRFFHWEIEFPDVFTQEGAGFHAVVGNPPWETQKPNSKEFFSNHDPLYRAYGKQEALRVQKSLFGARPEIEEQWLAYNGDFKDRGNFVKHAAEPFGDSKVSGHDGGDVSLVRGRAGAALHRTWRGRRARFKGTSDPVHPFRHQGSADLNTYKMFVEQGHALLAQSGHLGFIVPSGIYTDKGTGNLRKLLLYGCRWRWLYGFENRQKVFDIDSRFKFCVLIAEKGGRTEAIQAAFMRHDLEDWAEATGALAYPAERVTGFSPKSLSILEIRSAQDLAVLTKLYVNGVLLGDQGPGGWGIKYGTEFHTTNDSKLFVARDQAEEDGVAPDLYGRWIDDDGELLLPLYEGRMISQLDFSEKGWVSGRGRSAEWREIPWSRKTIEPQYLMTKLAAVAGKMHVGPKIAYMRIGSATNSRTVTSTYLRDVPAADSIFYFIPSREPLRTSIAVTGQFCSFTYDWAVRGRLGGLNLSEFLMVETPLTTGFPRSAERITLALSCPSPWFAPEWTALGVRADRPWRRLWAITPHERLRLRCMLDAIVAALYGLDRDDFAWILKDCDHPTARLSDKAFCRQLDPKGFWRVEKTEDPELRHTVLSLAAFNDLEAAIAAAGGDRDKGIQAFTDQHDGDGWMLPETLCPADLGLTRTVDVDTYDERAKVPQPVRRRMGPRFLDWQLEQSVEESWAECERHAKAILEGTPAPAVASPLFHTSPSFPPRSQQPAQAPSSQRDLFEK